MIVDGEDYIEISLIPTSFLLSSTFLEEISERKISREQTLSYLALNYTVFLLIDLKTGLCWDSDLNTYTCWHTGITQVINNQLPSLTKGIDMQVSYSEKEGAGLFKVSKFKSHLKRPCNKICVIAYH